MPSGRRSRPRISFAILILILIALSACQNSPAPGPAPAEDVAPGSPSPSATSTPTASTTPVPSATPLTIRQVTAIPTVTPHIRSTPLPTPIPSEPELAYLDFNCPTPRSLMLHSAFGPGRMQDLADEIEARGLVTKTYTEIILDLRAGRCPADNVIIVSIDDLGTNWMRPDFVSMIKVFTDRGMVLVVGVVVKGPQATFIWDFLRGLEDLGIEVSSHTVNHLQLSALSTAELHREVQESFSIICEHLGRCPDSLILPFGAGIDDDRVLIAAEDYYFVVSITGGKHFGFDDPPFYAGRIPPNNDDQGITMINLDRFLALNSELSTLAQNEIRPIRKFQPVD